MSKTQDKRDAREQERQLFLSARKEQQLAMIEQLYETGLRLYEDNKDKLSPEDVEQIEAMKADQLETIARLRAELDAINPSA